MAAVIRVLLHEECDRSFFPQKAHEDDVGFDLRSRIRTALFEKDWKAIPCGIFLAIQDGYEAQIRPRSGLALEHGITVLNAPGTIDPGYRGEVSVILINHGREKFMVERGMRIAQMVIQKQASVMLVKTDILPESDRGTGGFGSTGEK